MSEKEIWVDIPNYEGYYQVSSIGRVKSLSRKVERNGNKTYNVKERILKPSKAGRGYLMVNLYKDGARRFSKVHQLVAMAFLNHNPCGYNLVVNHKNFNRLDNRLENIEVVTMRENTNKKHLESTSKYVGVSWREKRKKWRASIIINGESKHLGEFKDEHEANLAYQKALKEFNK